MGDVVAAKLTFALKQNKIQRQKQFDFGGTRNIRQEIDLVSSQYKANPFSFGEDMDQVVLQQLQTKYPSPSQSRTVQIYRARGGAEAG